MNYYDQANALKEIRSFDEGLAKTNYTTSQNVLQQLDKAFGSFFRRIKRGDKPGFPRFKGSDRFNGITFPTYGMELNSKTGNFTSKMLAL